MAESTIRPQDGTLLIFFMRLIVLICFTNALPAQSRIDGDGKRKRFRLTRVYETFDHRARATCRVPSPLFAVTEFLPHPVSKKVVAPALRLVLCDCASNTRHR
jgi:hypothetical protein